MCPSEEQSIQIIIIIIIFLRRPRLWHQKIISCVHVRVVPLLVCLQITDPGEAFPAQRAAVGLLSCMDTLVLL